MYPATADLAAAEAHMRGDRVLITADLGIADGASPRTVATSPTATSGSTGLHDMTTEQHTNDVHVLLQALPYIQRFAGATIVVKFSRNAMSSPELFEQFAQDIVMMHSVGMRPVVIHGGGPQIGEWLRRIRARTPEFVDGQRCSRSRR